MREELEKGVGTKIPFRGATMASRITLLRVFSVIPGVESFHVGLSSAGQRWHPVY